MPGHDVTRPRALGALSGVGKELLAAGGQAVQTGDQSNQYSA